MYAINWTRKAVKQLMKVDTAPRKRILAAVTALTDLRNAPNVKPLVNHPYGYRLRVGGHRVLFDADDVIRIIEVQEIKKRDDNTY
jgi:mRNA-degrading endonuclease RelE of RelBE toxin-antitoxin system